MPLGRWLFATLLFTLASSLPAWAAPNLVEPLRTGLSRLKQGDAQGAYDQLRALAATEPENLGAECAVLLALDALGLDEEVGRTLEFETRLDKIIDHASSRRNRNAGDRDALFYLAQAYGARAGYRFEHGKGIWGAARDAAKAKRLSDEYVRLAPADADGYYTLGRYNYYVAIAPSFVRVLSVLLFLPPGNRPEGLKQIERAARGGELWGQEAQFTLIDIYSDLEGRPDEALRLALDLKRACPDNPQVLLALADTQAHPIVEHYAAAAAEFGEVVTRARAGHLNFRDLHLYRATSGLAAVQQQQWRLEEAIATLTPAIDARVSKPGWVLPNFLLRRGAYRSQLGDRRGIEDLQRILNDKKFERWQRGARRQLKLIEERSASGAAAIYTALISGNRMTAERRWSEAEAFYTKMQQQHPGDVQVRYRGALLEFERDRLDRAADLFNRIVAGANRGTPTWIKGPSMLYLARIHDIRGQRQQAIALYRRIVKEFDETDFAVQAAKVGLISPYRRATRTT